MTGDDWVITVSSVAGAIFGAAAAIFGGIVVRQGRHKEQRELERDEAVWDTPLMVRPEVVIRLEEGTASDVAVRAEWYEGSATARRASMTAGDEIRLATPALVPPASRYEAAMAQGMDVAVEIDWRTPQGSPRHERLLTGWASP